jgi:hypothetical protein
VRPQRVILQSPLGWLVAALVFTAADAFSILAIIEQTGRLRIIAIFATFIAGPAALVAWMTLFTGLGRLHIDVAAGTIEYRKGRTRKRIRLDELGALTITKRKPVTTDRGAKHVLEAAGFPDLDLFAMAERKPVVEMQERLERAVTRSAVRRVLASYTDEPNTAFRSAPALQSQLESAVPDAGLRAKALAKLARDDIDPEIRARAKVAANE